MTDCNGDNRANIPSRRNKIKLANRGGPAVMPVFSGTNQRTCISSSSDRKKTVVIQPVVPDNRNRHGSRYREFLEVHVSHWPERRRFVCLYVLSRPGYAGSPRADR